MTTITDIIDITISRDTATTPRDSFSVPMFLATHTAFAERYKEYASLTEVADDFTTTSNVYKAASAYFSQGQGLSKIVVGRRQVPSVTITPTVQDSTAYSFTLQNQAITFTSDSNATAAEIVTGLKSAIVSAGITDISTSGSTTLIISPSVAGTGYQLKGLSNNLTGVNASVTETVADSLNAILAASSDWFKISSEDHTDATILAIAAWAEANDKMYAASSQSSAIKTSSTSDIASQLKALNYNNTSLIYHSNADANFIECARVGYFAPYTIGSVIWCYKTLVGIPVDALTSSEANYIKGKNCSTYEKVGGNSVVIEDKVASGERIDVMQTVFWTKSEITNAEWRSLYTSPKLAMTNKGAAVVESNIRTVIATGIANGAFDSQPAPFVSVPNVLELTVAQRASNILPNVTFSVRLAGAIKYVKGIKGTVYA